MSEIKVNSIKGVGASAAAITVNNSDGTCTAKITNNLSNRNLIINGAMQVAQRGTSTTSTGYQTIDRINNQFSGADEAPTYAQADVASGTTPYTLGFRKCLKITNGNQTSGAGSGDYLYFWYIAEAQDIANSGWNYTSASSYITISYWVKSSVAQNFYGVLYSADGTAQTYVWETGSLSADTWTKITKTIPGNSNIQIDNDNGAGLYVAPIRAFDGTDRTASMSLNTWGAYSGSSRTPDATSTWYTTNDATLEVTGLQLEVGDHATDFEHRSYAQELALCQRYYQVIVRASDYGSGIAPICNVIGYQTNNVFGVLDLPVSMRSSPSLDAVSGTGYWKCFRNAGSGDFNSILLDQVTNSRIELNFYGVSSGTTIDADQPAWMRTNDSSAFIGLQAEL